MRKYRSWSSSERNEEAESFYAKSIPILLIEPEKEKTYWTYANRKLCSARLTTIEDEISTTPSEHVHPPTPIENHAEKVKEEIKLLAGRTEQLPRSIVEAVASDISLSVAGCFPKLESLKCRVRRKRPVINEDELYKTPRGDNVLLYRNDEVSIFGTVENLAIVCDVFISICKTNKTLCAFFIC
ncbi:uncharacterized protein LOC118760964 [Octopus sinensis]|uniref:Uncharacterized protein LOC118760964 n=1 Tax=Octopus sinensis TaxID=2607531 RepID=A0A7E6EGL7_9MOLL|nr:uncharacterized protein LOC118760964 [Octopus sinensis]